MRKVGIVSFEGIAARCYRHESGRQHHRSPVPSQMGRGEFYRHDNDDEDHANSCFGSVSISMDSSLPTRAATSLNRN